MMERVFSEQLEIQTALRRSNNGVAPPPEGGAALCERAREVGFGRKNFEANKVRMYNGNAVPKKSPITSAAEGAPSGGARVANNSILFFAELPLSVNCE
ncbi:hypothetical protein EVAR_18088_1 [Eumeta japonica]|uniref:Uncharacterized protein n=1 Tax=Eumeta variegata TaxID=151549 RepID=A0A4C1VI00_EUMVA|nr:hypothetical protein EVAR_18088_1 [Eumeta japonica]